MSTPVLGSAARTTRSTMPTWGEVIMISTSYLNEMRERWESIRDIVIEVATGPEGQAKLIAEHDGAPVELRVLRDSYLAKAGDVTFIGHAFSDIPRLLQFLESGDPIEVEEALEIGGRIAAASEGPWTAFIESDGGTGGSDVIRVSENGGEADMYLWMGQEPATSSIFRFVAGARQDLPALLAAVRR